MLCGEREGVGRTCIFHQVIGMSDAGRDCNHDERRLSRDHRDGCTATAPWLTRQSAVVLGGGGARGLAHLGAMQAIAENGFQVERIVGVSIGALAGAMLGTHSDVATVQKEVVSLLQSTAFQRHQAQFLGAAQAHHASQHHAASPKKSRWYRQVQRLVAARRHLSRAARGSSALPGKVLRELVNALVPDVQIEDLRFPLSIVTVDLLTGKRVVLESGSLRDAVQASASIPGVFPAVNIEGQLLCDIGVIDSLPTVIAKAHQPELLVAVDVGQPERSLIRCDSPVEAILRMQSIAEQHLRQGSLQLADIVLRPGAQNAWFDFTNPLEVIETSYDAVMRQLQACRFDSAAGTWLDPQRPDFLVPTPAASSIP